MYGRLVANRTLLVRTRPQFLRPIPPYASLRYHPVTPPTPIPKSAPSPSPAPVSRIDSAHPARSQSRRAPVPRAGLQPPSPRSGQRPRSGPSPAAATGWSRGRGPGERPGVPAPAARSGAGDAPAWPAGDRTGRTGRSPRPAWRWSHRSRAARERTWAARPGKSVPRVHLNAPFGRFCLNSRKALFPRCSRRFAVAGKARDKCATMGTWPYGSGCSGRSPSSPGAAPRARGRGRAPGGSASLSW